MKKKIIIFILGMIVGALLASAGILIYQNYTSSSSISIETDEDIVNSNEVNNTIANDLENVVIDTNTVPEMPDENNIQSGTGETPPDKPDGENEISGETPPDKPDGEN